MKEDSQPFIEYLKEDLSQYPFARTGNHPVTGDNYIDDDDDFLIGNSGGFLMNMNFIFINTNEYTEAAQHYMKYGKYTLHAKGTVQYNRFWSEEARRRRLGLVRNCKLLKKNVKEWLATGNKKLLKPLRITGDHYHYLNYGRMIRTLNDHEKEEARRKGIKIKTKEGFPRFWDGDYWNFKADEFCVNNDFNLCKGKARRKGYSFKRANQGANTLSANKDTTILLAAYDEGYLTDKDGTAWMLKTALDWLEEETYWRREFAKEDLTNIILGYKKQKGGNKIYGWNSNAISVSIGKNSSAAAGKGASEVDFEEAGVCPNLEEAIGITESTTESGAVKRGILRVYGTAGTKEANWKDFANIFYDPTLHSMMPFENIWDKNSRHTVCGFFHPQIWNMEPFMDKDGNSLLEEAYEHDTRVKEHALATKSQEKARIYIGQRANTPAEAFKSGVDNVFTSPGLVDHVHAIEYDPDKKYWRDGMVLPNQDGTIVFKTNQQLKDEGKVIHEYIENVPVNPKDDIEGCIREFHPPYRDADGIVPKDLYYISYDTVAKDKDKKEFIIKNSLNAIQVWMYPNNISNSPGDILVASYAGRPNTMAEADRIALHLAIRYNAKILVEAGTGETVSNFRRWGMLRYLARDPLSIINRKEKDQKDITFGVIIGDGDKKDDGIMYIVDLINTPVTVSLTGETKYNYHYISDLPLLKELINYESEGNYDRISAMIVAMYQRTLYRTLKKDKRQQSKSSNHKTMLGEIGLFNGVTQI